MELERRTYEDGSELTVSAVLARPALHALAVPLGVAGPVAQGEVPGLTVGGAGLAVVVLLTHHVVGEAQLALAVEVDVLRPVLAHRQRAARRQPADQVVLVLVPWTETQQKVSGAAGRTGGRSAAPPLVQGSGMRTWWKQPSQHHVIAHRKINYHMERYSFSKMRKNPSC